MSTKKPKLIDIKSLRYAIEVECEFANFKTSERLIEKNHVIEGWEVKHDGSLENGCEYCPKIKNKLYWGQDSLDQIKELLAVIRVHRGKANKNCGLHIHVDVANLTDAQILTIIKEFVHKQRFIVQKFKVDKHRLESMCQLLPTQNLDNLNVKDIKEFRRQEDAWSYSGYSYLGEKYYSLNVSHIRRGDYQSIEFRLFNGTLNYKKLKEYIHWTLNFVKDCLERE